MVVGLGYGDEGKGSWVDHLVRNHRVKYTVRFHGGAQANHTVVTRDGTTHGFSQFGAGTLVPGTMTILSRFMLIEPEALLAEGYALEQKGVRDVFKRLIVSENAPVITPFNRLLNRIKEVSRGAARHGSVGFGIGVTQEDVETLGEKALYVRDLKDRGCYEKLIALWSQKIEQAKKFATVANGDLRKTLENVDLSYYASLFTHFYHRLQVVKDEELGRIVRENDTIWEGAQGVLLDQSHGFFPFCTRSPTTYENAFQLLREWEFKGSTEKIGLLRGYGTRHGAGPFVTEDAALTLPACHNTTNVWQGGFRSGWFDSIAARYALEIVGGVDTLAITNIDRMSGLDTVKICTEYTGAERGLISSDRIEVLDNASGRTQKRTAAMQKLVPHYAELPGWKNADDLGNIERYLDTLSENLGHPIHAYSATADDRKIYRG